MHGGIPARDIDGLSVYWQTFPSLKSDLLEGINEKYYRLKVDYDQIRQQIYQNAEFAAYGTKLEKAFQEWQAKEYPVLTSLSDETVAKKLIAAMAEDIITLFEPLHLVDKYDVYQVLLAYWNDVMHDDVSLIISEEAGYGVAREIDKVEEKIKKGKDKGKMKLISWDGKLIPKELVIDAFFTAEKQAIQREEEKAAAAENELNELIENAEEDAALLEVAIDGKVKASDLEDKITELTQSIENDETRELEILANDIPKGKRKVQDYVKVHPLCANVVTEKGTITKTSIQERLVRIRTVEAIPDSLADDIKILQTAISLCNEASAHQKEAKELTEALDEKCRNQYPKLTDEAILDLLVNKKWFNTLASGIHDLYGALSHQLTSRVVELAERYEHPLPELEKEVADLEDTMKTHLEGMGFTW